jgi:hypothetical protein
MSLPTHSPTSLPAHPALLSPTHEDLIGAMLNERRLLERLLFRHAEVGLLIAAGEHRFVVRAIDEAIEVEAELATVELGRAVIAAGLPGGTNDGTLTQIASGASPEVASRILRLGGELGALLEEVNRRRGEAAAWAGERALQVSKALEGRGNAHAYSRDGSPATFGA